MFILYGTRGYHDIVGANASIDPYSEVLRQYRIILSADTASEVRQMLSQKRR